MARPRARFAPRFGASPLYDKVVAELGNLGDEDQAEFIHMEIYRDNDVNKGFRPQVAAWRLPTEPWVFTIDKTGKVAARLEGAFSARELEAAIQKALEG